MNQDPDTQAIEPVKQNTPEFVKPDDLSTKDFEPASKTPNSDKQVSEDDGAPKAGDKECGEDGTEDAQLLLSK